MNNALLHNNWLPIVLGLLLWAAFAYAEQLRYGRSKRAALRIGILFLAVTALVLVWLKPGYQAKGASTTILLQAEAGPALDSLLEEYPAATVLSRQPHPEYPQLEGISYLGQYAAPGSRLIVVGEPLDRAEFSYLQHYHVDYLPGIHAKGLQALTYTSLLSTADSLVAEGRWNAPAAGSTLRLSLDSQVLDSVLAEGDGQQQFVLKAPIFYAGNQVYQLYSTSAAGDTLEAYRLPLHVQEPAAYQLALLTAFPEAESKYLKDFLTSQGFRIQYEAQLAPGKALREWINLPEQAIQYTSKSLGSWDALVISASQYATLGPNRQEALTSAQEQAGLGILLYPDGEQNSLSWQESRISFGYEAVRDTLQIAGERVALEYRPIQQLPQGWQVLLRGPKGVAAISRRQGLGKTVITSGVASYTLLLKGAGEAYRRYWNTLLEEALPLAEQTAQWEPTLTAAIHRPLELKLHTQNSLPQARLLGPDQEPNPLALWQEPMRPNEWKAKFWPRQKGWYSAQLAGDTLHFWVSDTVSGLGLAQAREQFQQFIAGQARVSLLDRYEHKPLPLWLYYALFLTSMSALWLEKKLNG